MSYRLGSVSEARLAPCQVDLARVIRRAIELTTQDFQVFEVLRTLERQQELVERGASRTLDSFHIPNAAGVVHAADLVPFIGGKVQWQDEPCVAVARAMHRAAQHFQVPVTWGAVWDRRLMDLDVTDLEGEIDDYAARFRRVSGRRPLVDRPHFQVPRG